jgi:hypothetical protein
MMKQPCFADRHEVLGVGPDTGEQGIDHRSGFTLVGASTHFRAREPEELSNEHAPARAQRRLEQHGDEHPGLEHRQDRRRDLQVTVANGPDEVRDDGLPLVTIQPIEKAIRDQYHRVVHAETDGHGVHRIGVDHAHARPGDASRDRHLEHDVHHLLLGESCRVGLASLKTMEERADTCTPR